MLFPSFQPEALCKILWTCDMFAAFGQLVTKPTNKSIFDTFPNLSILPRVMRLVKPWRLSVYEKTQVDRWGINNRTFWARENRCEQPKACRSLNGTQFVSPKVSKARSKIIRITNAFWDPLLVIICKQKWEINDFTWSNRWVLFTSLPFLPPTSQSNQPNLT